MQSKRQKLQVNENFPRFPSFDFKYRAKSKTREPRNWAFFLLKRHCKVKVFSSKPFFRFLDFEFCMLPKIEVEKNMLKTPITPREILRFPR